MKKVLAFIALMLIFLPLAYGQPPPPPPIPIPIDGGAILLGAGAAIWAAAKSYKNEKKKKS